MTSFELEIIKMRAISEMIEEEDALIFNSMYEILGIPTYEVRW